MKGTGALRPAMSGGRAGKFAVRDVGQTVRACIKPAASGPRASFASEVELSPRPEHLGFAPRPALAAGQRISASARFEKSSPLFGLPAAVQKSIRQQTYG